MEATSNPDVELVVQAQSGNKDSVNELIEQHYGMVIGIVLRKLKNYADAEQVTQEVFIKATLKLDQLKEPRAFKYWLGRIANREALNFIRKKKPEIATAPENLGFCCSEQQQDPLLLQEQSSRVHRVLAMMGKIDREALTARFFCQMTVKEMASKLRCPEGTAKRRVHTAKKRFCLLWLELN